MAAKPVQISLDPELLEKIDADPEARERGRSAFVREASPAEVALGFAEGLKADSCVNLCNLFTVETRRLQVLVGSVGPESMRRVCRALAIPTACEGV